MDWLLIILMGFPLIFAYEFPPVTRSCPAITNTQLAGCNTDCGRVEVKLGGSGDWRQVCSSSWGDKEAKVVCNQLGFPKGGPVYTFRAKGEVGIWEVQCEGDEGSMAQCQLQLKEKGKCGGVAGVYCTSAELQVEEEGLQELQKLVVDQLERRHKAASSWVEEEGKRSCEVLPKVPRPFTVDLQQEAFIYSDQVAPLWTELSTRLNSAVCDPEQGPTIQKELSKLVDNGMRWGALGVTLPNSITKPQMELLAELYLAPSMHSAVTWEVDVVRAPPSPEGHDPGIDILYRDGIFKTDDWGFPSSLISQLSNLASTLLEGEVSSHFNPSLSASVSSTSNGTVITARLPLPQLESSLFNSSIPALVTGYLGPGARLSGYKFTRLSTTLERQAEDNYHAGLWHHDRTGRRLKIFVFLHDVDCEEGHPTEVAIGTNKLVYYATDSVPVSRFRDSYVRSQWRTERGCGAQGGGFIFDTHMVHKGTPRGAQARNVLILEFHPKYKCGLANRMGLGLPCPSGDQYVVDKLI